MPLVSATREHNELLRKATDLSAVRRAPSSVSTSMASIVAVALRVLRWTKYYVLINGFICAVALVSFQLVSSVHGHSTALVALYTSVLLRILGMVFWFEWIATMKGKIYGDKRHELTQAQRRAIYYRILWLVVPTECISYSMADPGILTGVESTSKRMPMEMSSFAIEYLLFIPKSLVFEVAFDLFHYIAHWTCHQITWLYQHVHKRHHWHLHPSALSTYEQDGVDLILTNVMPWVFATQLSPAMSPVQLHLLFAYKTYVEVAGHSGLEIKGFSFPQMPLVNVFGICLRVHDHDLHHTHPKFNFAKRFAIWDKLFRTFHPGRPLEDAKANSVSYNVQFGNRPPRPKAIEKWREDRSKVGGVMLAKWKAAVLARHRRREPMTPEDDGPAHTPPPVAKTRSGSKPKPRQRSQRSCRNRRDSDDDDMDGGLLSDGDDSDGDGAKRQRSRPSTPRDWRDQTLLQRALNEKNRLVQRVLVACRMAEASKDMYFKKKQVDYEQAIKQLEETRTIIELYAQSLYDVSVAMRGFAGNSSDVRNRDQRESISFLVAAETIEDKGHQFMEQVRERVLRSIDDHIEDLQQLRELLHERANLQIDVDYAKRTVRFFVPEEYLPYIGPILTVDGGYVLQMIVAQQRGDVNQTADKKRAYRIAQLRRAEATKKIAPLLRHYDTKQEIEFDIIISEFASITKHFFRDGAALLRAAEPPQRSRHSNATLLSARRLVTSNKETQGLIAV